MRLGAGRSRDWGRRVERREADAGPGGLLRALVAAGLDDYYAGRGESPGVWAGRGAELLGSTASSRTASSARCSAASTRRARARLRTPVRERTITVRGSTSESGEWREEQKRLAPVAGFDLVFSCPKSVSLLHALGDDERVRRAISEAHEAAWQAALAYLEDEACVVRRGRGGAIREHGEGFVAAAYQHRTSRAQDPHLHTHVIVANMARSDDGEWRALDGEAILRTYRLAAGYLYQAHLRHELTRRLGVEWTEPVKGMAELEGVPEEAIRAFSTRRQSLLEHMEAHGTAGFAAARVAALATRERRSRSTCRGCARTGGRAPPSTASAARELRALLGPPAAARESIELDDSSRSSCLGRDGLTAKQTTFTHARARLAVAGARPPRRPGRRCARRGRRSSRRFPGVELVEPERCAGPAGALLDARAARDRAGGARARAGRSRGRRPARASWTRPDRKNVRELSRRAADAGARDVHEPRPRRLRRRRRRRRQDDRAARPRRRPTARQASRSSAPRRAAAPQTSSQTATGIRSTTLHRLLLDAQREGGLPARLRAGRRRGRHGRDPRPRAAAPAGRRRRREGDPGRRPAPAPRRRRRRPLRRHLRPARRDRPVREPPPARPGRARRARAPPRPATPSLPRPRRAARTAAPRGRRDVGQAAACSRTGGRRPSATSPARSCSPTGATTSATSTTPPAR